MKKSSIARGSQESPWAGVSIETIYISLLFQLSLIAPSSSNIVCGFVCVQSVHYKVYISPKRIILLNSALWLWLKYTSPMDHCNRLRHDNYNLSTFQWLSTFATALPPKRSSSSLYSTLYSYISSGRYSLKLLCCTDTNLLIEQRTVIFSYHLAVRRWESLSASTLSAFSPQPTTLPSSAMFLSNINSS